MDAQQMHDLEMAKFQEPAPGSKDRLEALLAKKSASSSAPEQSSVLDPIEMAMREHPGLTREKAEQMAKAFGF